MNRFWIVILALAAFSCQEEVYLPLATIDGDVPVIEAVWTDNTYYNEVKISLAEDYFDTLETQLISDAEVFISEEGSARKIPFAYNVYSNSYLPLNTGGGREVSTDCALE